MHCKSPPIWNLYLISSLYFLDILKAFLEHWSCQEWFVTILDIDSGLPSYGSLHPSPDLMDFFYPVSLFGKSLSMSLFIDDLEYTHAHHCILYLFRFGPL